eukprot:TRINITY_DN6932_c0_g3_i2.p1 TRINITY_DN6932_c0_g3~~TRINITY_DN6932_c0_g3_i2.p1  ORF type:complete len:235 (+),score=53.34 TRINITY_DN6932_c0_g3_i2:2909-3613(+)
MTIWSPRVRASSTEVRVAFVKGKATQHFKLALPIRFERLYAKAEELFDLQVEDFGLKLDKESENLDKHWSWRSTDAFTVHVASKSIALHHYAVAAGLAYLTGGTVKSWEEDEEDTKVFLAADIESDELWEEKDEHKLPLLYNSNNAALDLLINVMIERIRFGVDVGQQKQHSRRELIGPILFTAAVLAGKMRIAAEYAVNGERAHGAIDWVYVYKKLAIIVCEVIKGPCTFSII